MNFLVLFSFLFFFRKYVDAYLSLQIFMFLVISKSQRNKVHHRMLGKDRYSFRFNGVSPHIPPCEAGGGGMEWLIKYFFNINMLSHAKNEI